MKTTEQQQALKQQQQSRSSFKQKAQDNSIRKARTRTLIQLGGLIERVGLTKLFNIELGEDLQLDLAATRKAAVLVGALHELQRLLVTNNFDAKVEEWRKIGFQLLEKKQDAK